MILPAAAAGTTGGIMGGATEADAENFILNIYKNSGFIVNSNKHLGGIKGGATASDAENRQSGFIVNIYEHSRLIVKINGHSSFIVNINKHSGSIVNINGHSELIVNINLLR